MTVRHDRTLAVRIATSAMRVVLATTTVVVFAVAALLAMLMYVGGPAGFENLRRAEVPNVDSLLTLLEPVLLAQGKSGRVEFLGTCNALETEPLPGFRGIAKAPRYVPARSVEQLRATFRNEPRVRISESDTTIIVSVGDVPRTLLETRIPAVSFEVRERYVPDLAMGKIEAAPTVIEAQRTLGVGHAGFPLRIVHGIDHYDPTPRVPERFVDVSFAEAQDRIASAFGGVILYGACASPRRYFVEYVELPLTTDWFGTH